MAVALVDAAAADLPDLREFWARVYRPDYVFLRSEALFHWQFGDAAAVKFHLKLARLDGALSAGLGYMPVEVTLGGRVVRGAWVVNWMVEPKYRRLGLGPLLMREVMRQFDVTLNIGPNQDAINATTRMGWADFGELTRHVCVLDATMAQALTPSGQLDWPKGSARSPASKLDVRAVKQFSSDATALWDESQATAKAGVRRSAAYLNWRYARHPLFEYRLLEARRDGRLQGLAVCRVERVLDVPVRVGRITELLAAPDAMDGLVDAVLNEARAQQVAVVDFFTSRPCEALRSHGFIEGEDSRAAQIPMLFQPVDRRRTGIRFLAFGPDGATVRAAQWFVTKGDGDQDRPN